ncbi:hypothetical protein DNAM5_102 [Haloarcula californiae tailed virus 1]|uniref:Uncharacterized protein n=1 Tax=Haloarcula californiae tailed virus 1 TaxID=1273746 RepID=R4TI13_9CAUD|nr:hypothetical protein M202_gp117 [Haloarcula californiae tailed virus 1]AGM11961.1 hypothetical protein DNAM5_102 [Haloarcula californiae tailed virus 1]
MYVEVRRKEMSYEAPSREEAESIIAGIEVGDEVRYLSDGEICEVQEVNGEGISTSALVITNGTRHHVCINDLTSTAYGDATVEVLE